MKVSDHADVVWVWGLPVQRLTMAQTLRRVEELIQAGQPGYVITANLHYAMLTAELPDLDEINRRAAILVADGMPLVWASYLKGKRLRERVCGSDLVYTLAELAAAKGYRLMLLGGAPGVGDRAAEELQRRYPGLAIAGVEVPPFRELTEGETAAMVGRVRAARPDILFAALGQPKGERFLAEHCEAFGVPVCVQLGAALDFAAGRVSRAPKLVQRLGLEWVYRLYQEPGRLAGRYGKNIRFVLSSIYSAAFETRVTAPRRR